MNSEIQRGFRGKLDEYLSPSASIEVSVTINGNAVYDYVCFGLDSSEKLSDENYMIFYNQAESPNREIVMSSSGNAAKFNIELSKLPSKISKLAFTASIDGTGVMGSINSLAVSISQNEKSLGLKLSGKDFQNEKAIIAIEIYKKDVWRLAAIGSGFNGGLSDLLKKYGGQEIQPDFVPKPEPKQESPPISISQSVKKINKDERAFIKNAKEIIVFGSWKNISMRYSIKALVCYKNGYQTYLGNSHSVESVSTNDNCVKYNEKTKNQKNENLIILWNPNITSVVVSLYSALENGFNSFNQIETAIHIRSNDEEVVVQTANSVSMQNSFTCALAEIIFGNTQNEFEILNVEQYSKFGSENRIGYKDGKIEMDIGPV